MREGLSVIYIDPPYNTGNEGWVYNDNVNGPRMKKWLGEVVGKEGEDLSCHDKWLCMMYPRLRLLHKLLAEDGIIFISIDSNEMFNNDPAEQRTDILFLDKQVALSDQENSGREYESIVIIELKRPMRDDYKPGENPIDQLMSYQEKLASNTVTDKNGPPNKLGLEVYLISLEYKSVIQIVCFE